uniref:Uncharacterized protein n=1 Tax=Anguilla anguilla TaxID=7936 RepID=A0A0E9XII6_ANGAN
MCHSITEHRTHCITECCITEVKSSAKTPPRMSFHRLNICRTAVSENENVEQSRNRG